MSEPISEKEMGWLELEDDVTRRAAAEIRRLREALRARAALTPQPAEPVGGEAQLRREFDEHMAAAEELIDSLPAEAGPIKLPVRVAKLAGDPWYAIVDRDGRCIAHECYGDLPEVEHIAAALNAIPLLAKLTSLERQLVVERNQVLEQQRINGLLEARLRAHKEIAAALNASAGRSNVNPPQPRPPFEFDADEASAPPPAAKDHECYDGVILGPRWDVDPNDVSSCPKCPPPAIRDLVAKQKPLAPDVRKAIGNPLDIAMSGESPAAVEERQGEQATEIARLKEVFQKAHQMRLDALDARDLCRKRLAEVVTERDTARAELAAANAVLHESGRARADADIRCADLRQQLAEAQRERDEARARLNIVIDNSTEHEMQAVWAKEQLAEKTNRVTELTKAALHHEQHWQNAMKALQVSDQQLAEKTAECSEHPIVIGILQSGIRKLLKAAGIKEETPISVAAQVLASRLQPTPAAPASADGERLDWLIKICRLHGIRPIDVEHGNDWRAGIDAARAKAPRS